MCEIFHQTVFTMTLLPFLVESIPPLNNYGKTVTGKQLREKGQGKSYG
jgi:hypothetical protein